MLAVLLIVLVVLKMFGLIAWSWWAVLFPLWILISIWGFAILVWFLALIGASSRG